MNPLTDRTVTLLHYSCPPVIGGAEFILEAQARWFQRYGADVNVIVGEGEQFKEGIPVHRIEGLASDRPDHEAIEKDLRKGNQTQFDDAVNALKSELSTILKDSNTWLIHNLLTMPFNLVATRAIRELIEETSAQTFPWIHDIAWIDDKYSLEDSYPWNLMRKPVDATSYVAISNFRREQLQSLFDTDVELNVIHDAVEFDVFHELDPILRQIYRDHRMYQSDIISVYPARIVRRKNFELALRIVKSLKDLGHKIHFVVTGPPDPHNQDSMEYYEELLNLRDELDLRDEVVFCYELKHPETGERLNISFNRVRQLYRISDVLLLTSRQEGFGLPLLEAALTRTVICCSDIPPLPEVGGEAPVYFDLDDSPDAIARQIHDYLETQSAVKLQRRVRKNFTWPAVFEQEIIPMFNQQFPLQLDSTE